MLYVIRFIGFAGDAGWFLLGLIAWAITLGAATIHVGNATSKNEFTFKGWL